MTLNDAEHWNGFYGKWKLTIPSQFCVMAALTISDGDQVIEFGCGNGRDAVCLSRYGAKVLAIDASEEAIQRAGAENSAVPESHLKFACCDVGQLESLRSLIDNWRDRDQRTIYYARFFLHSIDENRQNALLRTIRECMDVEDKLFLEFRTIHDAVAHKEFGLHYRRYIDHDAFRDLLMSNGFKVDYSVQGYGMAVFRGEDAHVARFIAGLA